MVLNIIHMHEISIVQQAAAGSCMWLARSRAEVAPTTNQLVAPAHQRAWQRTQLALRWWAGATSKDLSYMTCPIYLQEVLAYPAHWLLKLADRKPNHAVVRKLVFPPGEDFPALLLGQLCLPQKLLVHVSPVTLAQWWQGS